MPQRSDNSQRVLEHMERRKAAGERGRNFFVRDEHMQILRGFQIQHGYANQHSAMQALLEQFRADHSIGETAKPCPRNGNTNTREST